MPRMLKTTFCAAALGLAAGGAWAGKAHEHGIARLDVAVDPARVTLLLEMPLDTLLGFERAPRTDAERAQADAVVAKFKDAAALFRVDPAAQCSAPAVRLVSSALGLGAAAAAPAPAPAPPPAKEGHDDLEATIEFTCPQGAMAGFLELKLFDAFPRLKRVDVQAATRKGQVKATLKRPDSRVPLAR